MKILFIGPLPDPVTGQSLACKVFVDELIKSNDVYVINLSKSSFRSGFVVLGRILEIIKILYEVFTTHKKCDLIYFTVSESFWGNMKDFLIYILCFQSLNKMIIHLHGGAGMIGLMKDRYDITGTLNRFFLNRIGAIIVLGDRLKCVYSDIKDQSKIFVVKNFAQAELCSNAAAVEKKYSNLGIIKLLYLSNLLPGKGYTELLNAYKNLTEDVKYQFSLDFAGGFESEKDKDAFVHAIRDCSQIQYHGVVRGKEKENLFLNAHVFCLPTYYAYEGQPISILEAYASGCVVVTTDHSGILDIFKSGENGFLVKKKSVDSLKSVLEALQQNKNNLYGIALSNLKLAADEYTVGNYNAALIQVFDFVIKKYIKV